jgi:predicted pyridoxine 5'-phosphate oxidase superfamily flavin-nucleotide-binding protein
LNGNNRLDSYRNIVTQGRAGVLMVVPGKDETLRINGPAAITTDPEILSGFTKELRPPKAAVVIETAEIYGHCAKAFRRGKVWDQSAWAEIVHAPDLAGMYACTWSIDETEMRNTLEQSYHADIAAD